MGQSHVRITCVVSIVLGLTLLLFGCQAASAPSAPAKPAEPAKVEAPAAPAPAKQAETKPAESKPAEPAKAEAPAKPAETKPAEAPKAEVKPAAKEPYRIGLISEISGPYAMVGTETRDGVVLEVERVNAAGGVDGHPLELVIEDETGDPTKAATAITKLIRQDRVLAIIGPTFSGVQPAARPITERDQVPEILVTTADADTRSKNYKWSFNLSASEMVASEGIVDVLKDKGYKKVVVVAESGAMYLSIADRLKADGPSAGIQVTQLQDTFNMKDVDVTPQATKLKDLVAKEKQDAVVLVTSGYGTPTFLKAMKQLGIDLPTVGNHLIGAQAFLDLAGPAANGIIFPSYKALMPDRLDNADPQKPIIVDFFKRYKAKYNKDIGVLGVTTGSVDAVNIFANAIKIAGADPAKIRDAVEKTSNFPGLMGIYSFKPDNHEGPGKQSLAVYEVKDAKFSYVRSIK